MAEKLEDLSVKDKASDEKKEEEEKKETEKKDEKKEVKTEEKNWEPGTCFADLQFISFSFFFFYNRLLMNWIWTLAYY